MAISTIQLVDTDLSTVLFDLHSSDGSTNSSWGSVVTKFGLGGSFKVEAPHDAERFQHPALDGAFTTFSRRGLGTATWRQVVTGSSEANLRLGIGRLTDLVTRGGILRIVTGTTTRYLRFEPSPYPQTFQGKELELHDIYQQFAFRQGLDISLACQPFWEGAEVTVSGVTVPNDPTTSTKVRVLPTGTVTGDLPTPGKVKVTMDSGATVEKVYVASRAQGLLAASVFADYLSDTGFLQCESTNRNWTITLGTDTSSTADANASGGNMARKTHATNPTLMQRAIRATRTTKVDSLRGSWRVWLRLKPSAVADYFVQLRWGLSSSLDPAVETNAEVEFEVPSTAINFAYYSEIDLGTITIPPEGTLGGLALEVWTRRESGSGNLDMDFLWLQPEDPRGVVTVASSSDEVLGSALTSPPADIGAGDPTWVAGAVSGTALVLNANNEAGGIGPNGGTPLAVGRHVYTFHLTGSAGVNATAKCSLANITDSTESGTTLTVSSGDHTHIVVTDAVTAKNYQARYGITSYTSGSVTIRSVDHEFVPTLGNTESVQTDPQNYQVHRLDGSSNIAGELGNQGALGVILEPGPNHIMVRCDEVIKPVGTYNENILTRTPTVSVTYFPRFAF